MSLLKEILNKIKSSALLKSGLAVTAAKSFVIIGNFLIFFILVRICTPTDFGTWILYTSIIVIFEVANNSFVSNAIIKYYNDYRGELSGKFIYNAFAFSLFLTLVISLLLFVSIYFINLIYNSSYLNELLWYGPLILLCSGLINVLNCIEQGNLRFYGQLISSILKSGIFIIYLFYLFLTKSSYDLHHFVIVNIIAGFLSLLLVFFTTKKYFRLTMKYDFIIIKKIAKYGFFTFGIEVIGQISGNIGQLISGALLSPAAVGIINVATRVLQFIEIPLQSVSSVLMPQGVITLKEKGIDGIKILYEKSSALIVVVMLPILILFFVFSDQVIYLIAGENFGQASILLKIIIFYSLFKPFGRNAGVILNAIGKTRINFFMILIPTAINLIFNYYLIKQLGVRVNAFKFDLKF
ncbi:lipopolysaccharide exporter [Pedobacter sp. CG_S7]|uniref:lipopolysaccharide biosynthesis protein n=1 Tax=Pedobacter sp. CG_S7 TaxID=3143930 RepID=UPI0033912E05